MSSGEGSTLGGGHWPSIGGGAGAEEFCARLGKTVGEIEAMSDDVAVELACVAADVESAESEVLWV